MPQTLRLADYVADFVHQQGVNAVFLVPGGGNMYLADAMGSHPGINYVPHHHEQAAGIAAEAYGRVRENVGVALVTTGPGGTNAMTPVAGAWIDSLPLVILSGQVKRADLRGDTGVRQMGPQEVDVVTMVQPITKYAATVMDPQDIRYHIEKAFHLARTGRRGPCWVDIPLDVQASQIDPSTLRGFTPDPAEVDVSDAASLEETADMLLAELEGANRPLLLAGHGVRLAGAADVFRELADQLNIPVVTTWLAMDLFPSAHRLSVGRPGTVALRPPNFAVQNSDLLIAIGARLDNVTTAYNQARFGREAKKIVVDIDPAELGKFGDAVDIKVQADARALLEVMLAKARKRAIPDRAAWLAQCETWKTRFPINDGKPFPKSGLISHYHLVSELSEAIPEDTLIVTGSSGLAVEIFYAAFQVRPGQRIFLTSGLGAMGYGLPALIGGGIAVEGRPYVAMESDGSLMMNAQELQTIAAQKLPVRLFVFNNGGYASIRNTQRNYFAGRFVGTGPEAHLTFPDITKLAEVHGIPAITVSDAADLHEAVRQTMSSDGPVVCNVQLVHDEQLAPKSAAIAQPDGSLISMPLEDMNPLLSLDELRQNMLIELDPASLKARQGQN